jgi:ribosome-binding protein aMBF1 (putative translation factor)
MAETLDQARRRIIEKALVRLRRASNRDYDAVNMAVQDYADLVMRERQEPSSEGQADSLLAHRVADLERK